MTPLAWLQLGKLHRLTLERNVVYESKRITLCHRLIKDS